jgi:secondary thiamine-phosphate synthase enzyme
MQLSTRMLVIQTNGPGLVEITRQVEAEIRACNVAEGLATLFCRHTSASLLVQENADPSVQRDLQRFFERIAPHARYLWEHDAEGPDDMPAHVRAALTQTSLTIPVSGQTLAMGTWQGVYLFEHRDRPHRREISIHVIGEPAG